MMRSLFSGVSGLKNHQTRMDTIGNNISNVNTTGFKSSRTTFVDTLSQTLSGASSPSENIGGTNAKQIGLGSSVASVDLIFTDGSVQSTGKNTDLCLSGSGLFVVHQGDSEYYTRNGNFEFDADGNYVLAGTGYKVQGWMGNDGVLNTSATPTGITIPAGKSMASKATTQADYSLNLNASTATIKSISGGNVLAQVEKKNYTKDDAAITATTPNPVTVTLKDGTTQVKTTGSYKVGDSYLLATETGSGVSVTAGTGQTLKLYLEDGTVAEEPPGTFAIDAAYGSSVIKKIETYSEITGLKNLVTGTAEATAGSPITITMSDGTNQTLISGTYNLGNSLPVATTINIYDSLGAAHTIAVNVTKIDANTWQADLSKTEWTEADGTKVTASGLGCKIFFKNNGAYDTVEGDSTINLVYENTDEKKTAAPGQVSVNFLPLTQYSGSSTINAAANGNAAGNLESVSIDKSGVITGTYSNGVIQAEAQVAIAQFNNNAGLTKTGTSLYQKSNNSGEPNIKTATDLGVTITPSALEMSNVDIANEFSDMIITQRGFQSNSKIITVSDEMLETLINMKR